MVEIFLNRTEGYQFEAKNSSGIKVQLDGPKSIGGGEQGFRPMEMLLVGLGGCSAFDIVSILQKQKQTVDDFSIAVKGERSNDIPSVYTEIKVEFVLKGNLNSKFVQKAVNLSMDKYCSVAKMLGKIAQINWSYKIVS